MIDIAIDSGDLVVSNYGDVAIEFTEEDDIIQMANSAINTIKYENIFHAEYGNDAWNKRLKISESGFATIEACAKDAILNADSRVQEVVSISASKGDEYASCIIEYSLLTEDGETISSRTNINIL